MGIISTAVATTFVKNIGDTVFSFGKNKINGIADSKRFNEDLGYYIETSSERIGKVRTLFYDSIPKNIFDFYQPLKLTNNLYQMNLGKDEDGIDTSSVSHLLEEHGNLLIVGHGGSGKTFLFKYLFLNSISENYKIPIYLELRNFNEYDGKFIDFLLFSLKNVGFEMGREFFLESLKSNKFVFFFDAFDEVYPEKQEVLSTEIKFFCDRYVGNKFILSCRFAEGFNNWSTVSVYRMLGLTENDALSLVAKIDIDEKWKHDFMHDLENGLYQKYESFASSPLLLNIMLLTYGETSTLPDKLDKFYEKAFETLFFSHDLSKNRYKRKLESGLTYEQIKRIFSRICFNTYQKSQYTFTFDEIISVIEAEKLKEKNNCIREVNSQKLLNDLEVNLCMFVKEGLHYSFVHRSFQEYFAAIFIDSCNESNQKIIYPILINKKSNNMFFISFDNFWQIMYEINQERFIDNAILNQINELLKKNIGAIDYFCDLYSTISYSKNEEGKKGLSLVHDRKSRYNAISELFKTFIMKDSQKNFLPQVSSSLIQDRKKRLKNLHKSIVDFIMHAPERVDEQGESIIPTSILVKNNDIKELIISNSDIWFGTSTFVKMLNWKKEFELGKNTVSNNFLDEL